MSCMFWWLGSLGHCPLETREACLHLKIMEKNQMVSDCSDRVNEVGSIDVWRVEGRCLALRYRAIGLSPLQEWLAPRERYGLGPGVMAMHYAVVKYAFISTGHPSITGLPYQKLGLLTKWEVSEISRRTCPKSLLGGMTIAGKETYHTWGDIQKWDQTAMCSTPSIPMDFPRNWRASAAPKRGSAFCKTGTFINNFPLFPHIYILSSSISRCTCMCWCTGQGH